MKYEKFDIPPPKAVYGDPQSEGMVWSDDLVASSPQGRLTLTTGTPVLTGTVSGATTVYYSPYIGQACPIYNGSGYTMTDLGGELSQTTSDTTKSPAAVAASSVYDVFVWNDSGTLRATRGPAWTSTTARGTGAGTSELLRQNGIWLNKNAITNGPAASRGTYVGTIASNGSSTVDFIFGAAASGGTAAVLNVWNYYNRIDTATVVTDNGTSYTYSSATVRQARASAGNQITVLSGMAEDGLWVSYNAGLGLVAANASMSVKIGLDSTTTGANGLFSSFQNGGAAANVYGTPTGIIPPQLGSHVISANEASDGSNANVFNHSAINILSLVFRM